MQLPDYMQTRFPGLQLSPALFYSWTIGVRFELNPDRPYEHRDTILDRATILYESVFQQGDIGFLVSGHDVEFTVRGGRVGKLPKFRNSVFTLSRKEHLGLHGVAGRQRVTAYDDANTRTIGTFRWTRIEPRRIGYKRILEAIMHRDFPPKRPRVNDYVYFVNQSRNMILHMYDDRGLDVIALQIDDLRPIYHLHKDWILRYDREAIEEMFESNKPIPNFDYRRSPAPWKS